MTKGGGGDAFGEKVMERGIKNGRKISKWRRRKTNSEMKERQGEIKRNG
jgi:hypothetical protein